MAGAARRAAGSTWVRAVVSLLLIGVIAWKVGPGRIAGVLSGLDAGWFCAGVAACLAANVLAAGRWWRLMRVIDVPARRQLALRLHFTGMFLNNVLPSSVGGDAYRALAARRCGLDAAHVAASLVMERLSALWALSAIGTWAAITHWQQIPDAVRVSMLAAAAVSVAVTALAFWAAPGRALGRLVGSAHPRLRGIGEAAGRAADRLSAYRRHPVALTRAFGAAITCQALIVVSAWALARSVQMDVSWQLLAAVIPAALLATALPVSINGLGVRELVFKALLVPAGVASAQAVSFSLLTMLSALVVSLIGGVLMLRGGPSPEPVKVE